MIDVNVLTGADVRRIDGKYGKVSKVSMPWVTVKWDNGMEESYLRSDESLAEDMELKTLDKGWISLGSVVGVVQETAMRKPKDVKAGDLIWMNDRSFVVTQNDKGDLYGVDVTGKAHSNSVVYKKSAATLIGKSGEFEGKVEVVDSGYKVESAEEAASTKDLIAEARRLAFCLSSAYRRIEEARQSTKEKAKALKAKKAAKKEKAPPKAKTGGANNPNPTNPFHNYKTIGKYSPKKKKRTEKKIWKCSKSGDGQMCVAQKDVPEQGIKKGQEKFITRWAGKEAYDTDYDMGRAAGDYKLPNKAVAAVAHKYY